MGITTKIEWCDSTVNGQMGCKGCELWIPEKGVKRCYAGTLTERYAGGKGWPVAFDEPAVFPGRIEAACRWPDLTGTERPGKPWLNGMPRMIFLDDMGDTFTEGLPIDWLMEHVPAMEASPHIWMFLTKRASRMRQFFEQLGRVPANFWPGVTVTGNSTLRREDELLRIIGAPVRWLSVEPLLEHVVLPRYGFAPAQMCDCPRSLYKNVGVPSIEPDLSCTHCPECGEPYSKTTGVSLVIVGGESGPGARPFALEWAESLIARCVAAGVACFVKQLGSNPTLDGQPLKLRDKKGGDMSEWPEALRVRQFPTVPTIQPA
jgi:protein gp37